MKSKHKIALTVLASLGLLTMGATVVNAKSVDSGHQIHLDNPVQIVNPLNSRKILYKIANKGYHKILIQKDNKKLSSLKLSKKGKDNRLLNNNKDLKSEHDIKPEKLAYHHTLLPNKPLRDNNHSNIGNMNHFIKLRKPYLYTDIGGNTRDLGGYPTSNHKYRIRNDRIIRSADLDGLSEVGLQNLQQLHVNKVVDLRYPDTKDGIEGHPDPNEAPNTDLNGTKIKYQYNPVYSYHEAHQFDSYLKNHGIHGEYYFYGAPSVTEPQARKAYRQIFKDLLNNRHGAILFHCNLGRDRTGTTSALILSALGVNRNVIYHDYLLTDHYHYKYHSNHSIQPYPKQAGELSYFFRTIDSKYGSVKDYLKGSLHLSDHDIHKLRRMYLVPSKDYESEGQNTVKANDNHQVKINHKTHKLIKKSRNSTTLIKRGDHKVEKASNH